MLLSLKWKTDYINILDQTKLPGETAFRKLYSIEEVYEAIQHLRVRGAPLIGIAAAYGLYLGIKYVNTSATDQFFKILDEKIQYLSAARPTAVNLFWALQNLKNELLRNKQLPVTDLKEKLLELAIHIHEDDKQRCENIALSGQEIVADGNRILTHCNTGILATGGIGTALGVIYKAVELGKKISVYADETRPLLQGARLTVWELQKANIPVTLICDNMAGFLMQQEKADMVLVGADRISANGATANKIGTYALAVLAKHHGIPFFVAAPLSTFDLSLPDGQKIPIEERNCREIKKIMNEYSISMEDADCWNPAFDITPPELITGFITENGIISPPFEEGIKNVTLKKFQFHN